jgi:hypothetical protein
LHWPLASVITWCGSTGTIADEDDSTGSFNEEEDSGVSLDEGSFVEDEDFAPEEDSTPEDRTASDEELSLPADGSGAVEEASSPQAMSMSDKVATVASIFFMAASLFKFFQQNCIPLFKHRVFQVGVVRIQRKLHKRHTRTII